MRARHQQPGRVAAEHAGGVGPRFPVDRDETLEEQQGEFQQALGASYEISPRLSVGLEFLHEFVFPEWRDAEKIRNVFVGPNVSYRRNQWFVTVTALAQATDTEDEPNFQLRTIFGIGF